MNYDIFKKNFIALKLYFFSTSNKHSFWFASYNGRKIIKFISKIVCFLSYTKLFDKSKPTFEKSKSVTETVIEKDFGYLDKIDLGSEVDHIVKLCEDIFARYQSKKQANINNKSYLSEIELSDYNEEMNQFVNLGLNHELIKMISEYFGETPIINEIRLFHSENKEFVGGSQLFHVDKECHKSFKVFISITDNDDITPNQNVISSKTSEKIIKLYGRNKLINRFSDEFIQKVVKPSEIQNIYGNKGDVWGIDVCNCLHFGSRPSSTPRTLLWIMYLPKSHYRFPYSTQKYKRMDLTKFSEQKSSLLDKYVLIGN